MSLYPHETLYFDNPLFKIKFIINSCPRPSSDEYNLTAPTLLRPSSYWHEQLEFLIFREGGARVYCNEESYISKKGDVFIINPFDCHSVYYFEGTPCFDCIMVDDSIYRSLDFEICSANSKSEQANTQISFNNLYENDEQLYNIFCNIITEYKEKNFAYDIAIKRDIFSIFTLLLRDKNTSIIRKTEKRRFIEYYKQISPVVKYIENNYSDQITLQELADMCSLEKTYFCRIFKKVMGDSCIEYLNKYRLEKAMLMLKNSCMNVSEIAYSVGFLDAFYFTRRFKKYYGSSPNKNRKEALVNTAAD